LAVGYENEIDIKDLIVWASHEDKIMQDGVKLFLYTLNVLKNPTSKNCSIFLKDFCERNIIDISDDLGKQDLFDELKKTFIWEKLFSQYSKEQLFGYLKNMSL